MDLDSQDAQIHKFWRFFEDLQGIRSEACMQYQADL